ERGKPDRRAAMGGDQRQLDGKPRAERLDIVRRLRPRLLLRLAVIVAGQFLDAGPENLRQERHILRQHRAHREFFLRAAGHGTYSHVVTGSPVFGSLLSFTITCIFASLLRMRSSSLKSFALRAAFRASIKGRTSASAGPAPTS